MSTVRYSFHVKRADAGAPKRLQAGKAAPVADKVPRIARLFALAHKFQGMLDRGDVESMAALHPMRLNPPKKARARVAQRDCGTQTRSYGLYLQPLVSNFISVSALTDGNTSRCLATGVPLRSQWTGASQ